MAPSCVLLAIAEAVYAVTDPIMRFVRRFIPPLRIGPVAIDISFILIFFVTEILISFAHRIN
ncbi:MAG: YggT family protein [Actinomycetota bacterium]